MGNNLVPRNVHAIGPVVSPFEQLQELLNLGGFGGFENPLSAPTPVYDIDVEETNDTYKVFATLPGFDKKSINVSVTDNVLTIQARRDERTNRVRNSSSYNSSYNRSFSLPSTIKTSGVVAAYLNGVLEITLPKSENAKSRKIVVE